MLVNLVKLSKVMEGQMTEFDRSLVEQGLASALGKCTYILHSLNLPCFMDQKEESAKMYLDTKVRVSVPINHMKNKKLKKKVDKLKDLAANAYSYLQIVSFQIRLNSSTYNH